MKKILGAIALLLIASLVIALTSILSIEHHQRNNTVWATKLEMRWQDAFQKHQPVFLPDLTPFYWEKACFIEPYSMQEEAQALVGKKYRLGEVDTIDEGLFNAVFAMPDNTTFIVVLPRSIMPLKHYNFCRTYEEMKETPLPAPAGDK